AVIDLRPSAEEELVRDTAAAFARERLTPAMRAHEARGAVDPDVVRAWRALGFATMDAPPDAGGQGLGAIAKVLVLEELGAGDPGAALPLDGAGPALGALLALDETALVRRVAEEPALRVALVVDLDGRLACDGRTVRGIAPWVPVPADGAPPLVVLQPD